MKWRSYKLRQADILFNFLYTTLTFATKRYSSMDIVSISFLYYFILESRVISSVGKLVENSIINKIMFITTKYVIVIVAILKLFEDEL